MASNEHRWELVLGEGCVWQWLMSVIGCSFGFRFLFPVATFGPFPSLVVEFWSQIQTTRPAGLAAFGKAGPMVQISQQLVQSFVRWNGPYQSCSVFKTFVRRKHSKCHWMHLGAAGGFDHWIGFAPISGEVMIDCTLCDSLNKQP